MGAGGTVQSETLEEALAKQMRLRVAPEVRFFADESEHEAGKFLQTFSLRPLYSD